MSFKDKLAFFQNAVSQQNTSIHSNARHSGLNTKSSKDKDDHGHYNQSPTVNDINKQSSIIDTTLKSVHQKNQMTKRKHEEHNQLLSPDNGFQAKMAFFKNQINNQDSQLKPIPNKESHREQQRKQMYEERKMKMSKSNHIKDDQKSKPEELKIEEPTSTSNAGFAEKMAFFNNQVKSKNNQTEVLRNKRTHKQPTKNDEGQNKIESSHQRANIADRVALFNNLKVPLGKPAETKNKSNKVDYNTTDMFSQKEPSTLSEILTIEKNNDEMIMLKNDVNPNGLGIRRQNKCRSQRRRPEHIPEL